MVRLNARKQVSENEGLRVLTAARSFHVLPIKCFVFLLWPTGLNRTKGYGEEPWGARGLRLIRPPHLCFGCFGLDSVPQQSTLPLEVSCFRGFARYGHGRFGEGSECVAVDCQDSLVRLQVASRGMRRCSFIRIACGSFPPERPHCPHRHLPRQARMESCSGLSVIRISYIV
ncbi:hypothetical protein L209DRAFT_35031 [Thermothelomyces heterothallicus CBS 203.75]